MPAENDTNFELIRNTEALSSFLSGAINLAHSRKAVLDAEDRDRHLRGAERILRSAADLCSSAIFKGETFVVVFAVSKHDVRFAGDVDIIDTAALAKSLRNTAKVVYDSLKAAELASGQQLYRVVVRWSLRKECYVIAMVLNDAPAPSA